MRCGFHHFLLSHSLGLTKLDMELFITIIYSYVCILMHTYYPNTPRDVVFYLAGCLPGQAVLHCRQLSLFPMVCHLHSDPLHTHAEFKLTPASPSRFQQIRDLCFRYGLPNHSLLLDNPPKKETFKGEVKRKIVEY